MKPYHVKRFVELWRGDPAFRLAAERGPAALVPWHLDLDAPGALEPLCRLGRQYGEVMADLPDDPEAQDHDHPAIHEYLQAQQQRRLHSLKTRARIGIGNEQYAEWRALQIGRLFTQCGRRSAESLVHAPFTIELSDGCSIGCSYCGLGAGPLRTVARFTSENELLFRGVLRVLADFFGESARYGFLYWATEPLDNRDYELYLHAFFEQFHLTPQTTTAAWHRKIDRSRRLIAQSERDNGVSNRFSINSLDELHKAMAAFTAEELAHTSLVFQHPEASPVRVSAGYGRDLEPDAPAGTIACVSGFLINLPKRSVALISPCTDLESWPLGYAVYREATFQDAEALRVFVAGCKRDFMGDPMRDETVPRFRDDLVVAYDEDAFTTRTRYAELRFASTIERAILKRTDGRTPVGQIVRDLSDAHDPARLYFTFRRLYECGLFEHLPRPALAATCAAV